jgi:hypothetical protein
MLAAALALVGAASAGASSSIEGVWAFDNGQIAIASLPNGTFVGTVVEETQFAECAHPVGQPIWTGITPQPDGSYWGHHQWYFEGTCAKNPTPGPTAWRVRQEPDGSEYLRVCFSQPGASQPTIPASGPEANVAYGCDDSALTAPLPVAATSSGAEGEHLSLPSARRCVSARRFKIHLRDPKYDPLKKVLVTIKGRRIATARQGGYVVATIDLKGFKRGAFTVEIRATTVLGHHLSVARTYHTCARRAKKSKLGKLG